MGLLDTILSTIDAKKRSAKRGIMDMLDNPQQWAGMQANRIQEDRYGGADNAQAMKQYLSKQPYDKKALTAANDALRNAAINESLGAIFVGKGAKTWDKMKEADAMARLAKGEDAATVWKETGVGVAPWDKMARGEISDHAAKLDLKPDSPIIPYSYGVKGDGLPLSGVLSHVEQYAAYPDSALMPVNIKGRGHFEKGSYQERVGANNEKSWGKIFADASTDNTAKSVTLHELQHAIQSKEGFAKGGNPEMFNPKEAEKARDILSWRKEVEQWIGKNWPDAKVDTEVLRNADQRLRDEYGALGAYDMVPPVDLRDTALSHTFKVGSKQRDDMAQMVKEYGLDQRVSAPSAKDMYNRLAGEAESRLTQYRMNLTPEARSALYPYDPTYFKQATGVDIDKLITRGLLDDGPAMSVAPKLTEFEQRHLTAQKNAALPVEQGGLGLPPNNTAMDRARAMGFDTDVYHGTGADVQEFEKRFLKKDKKTYLYDIGVHGSLSPETANEYAQLAGFPTLARNMSAGLEEGAPVVYPLMARSGNVLDVTKKIPDDVESKILDKGDELFNSRRRNAVVLKDVRPDGLLQELQPKMGRKPLRDFVTNDLGFDSVKYPFQGENLVVTNPNQLRSRFAAFDPMRRHEADLLGYADPYLLGAMGAGGLLGMGGYSMMNDK